MYILIGVVGYLFLAITNIFDKFILTKAVQKPIVFVFYSTAIVTPILILVPLGAGYLSGYFDYFIAAIGGVFFTLGLWAMYKGFIRSEISHASPLVGAATPFFVLILSSFFLSEQLSGMQIAGVIVLIIGSLLTSFEKSNKHHGLHIGMLWIILAAILYAISHVASKYIYDAYSFYSGLVWTRGFMGLSGVLLLFSPSVYGFIFKSQKNKPQRDLSSNVSKQFGLVMSSRVLAVVAVILIQYAISLGSVTIVNALAGVQFAFLIVVVALLTKFAPKLFKEKFERGELFNELISVVVIGVGLVLLVL